jgi:hypothetical protein
MKQDRFLFGILIFIVLLVVVALGLFFLRQDSQTYGAEGTPEGVVRNYSLAVQNMDFERAYAYLAEGTAKPTLESFRMAFLNRQLDTSNAAVQIGSTRSISGNQAVVDVSIQFSASDPFSSPWTNKETANLVKEGGKWKLTYMPNPYWGWDWYTPTVKPVP